MVRLLDVYTIVGGDEGATYAGRGYNAGVGNWHSATTGATLEGSRTTKLLLRDADFVVQSSTGALKLGVVIWAFIRNDPTNPSLTTPWFVGVQGKRSTVKWQGKRPMNCGFFWRCHRGGLVAGDVVTFGVGYE